MEDARPFPAPLRLRDTVVAYPVFAASGAVDPCSDNPDWRFPLDAMRSFGAAVTKTTTLDPRSGNPQPWVELMPGDERTLVNAVGLANPGFESTCEQWRTMASSLDMPIFVSIGGTADSCAHMARELGSHAFVSGIEVNLSCPNTEAAMPASRASDSAQIISSVRAATELPIIAKLSPASDIASVAGAVAGAGADAITAINTMPVHVRAADGSQLLGSPVGGMSGERLHPIALYCVAVAARASGIPVIGVGGVASLHAVQQMMSCGASGVGIGTAAVLDPSFVRRLQVEAGCIPARNML